MLKKKSGKYNVKNTIKINQQKKRNCFSFLNASKMIFYKTVRVIALSEQTGVLTF